MKVRFWGVRGSVPTPITPQQIQNKISAVIQRITEKDIETYDAREKFIANLPDWLYGTTGGNTSCVEFRPDKNTVFVLDCGTGLREFGLHSEKPQDLTYHIFLSHFHWDHLQGLPFFGMAYNPSVKLNFYSTSPDAEKILRGQQNQPYFPVPFDAFTKNVTFTTISEGKPFNLKGTEIITCRMPHPGGSWCYSFSKGGKKFVYATDVEIGPKEFIPSDSAEKVFKNADAIVIDSQYTVEEIVEKEHWGHSAFCYAVDFAVYWEVKKLYLFHHEPAYDDKKLNSILQSARWYAKFVCHSDLKVYLAMENQEFEV